MIFKFNILFFDLFNKKYNIIRVSLTNVKNLIIYEIASNNVVNNKLI